MYFIVYATQRTEQITKKQECFTVQDNTSRSCLTNRKCCVVIRAGAFPLDNEIYHHLKALKKSRMRIDECCVEHLRERLKVPLAEWFLCWMDCTRVGASKVTNSIVGMVFGWLVCVGWLLRERETFICYAQSTMKCRKKQFLIFTLYLSKETQCTNTIIFMPSLAGISNFHSCCCLLTFFLYQHFLPFIPFLPDNGSLPMLWVAPTTLLTVLPNLAGPVQVPSWKAWCFGSGVCPCLCECWELQLFKRIGSQTCWILGLKFVCGLSDTLNHQTLKLNCSSVQFHRAGMMALQAWVLWFNSCSVCAVTGLIPMSLPSLIYESTPALQPSPFYTAPAHRG